MQISPTNLRDVQVVRTRVYRDDRGMFMRLFCRNELKNIIGDRQIQQINYSITSKKGTVRGLHFQHPPKAEAKFVRCLRGSVFDVAVDLRAGSETFLQRFGTILSGKNGQMICIPEGCAHGFQTLDDSCELLYIHTESYSPEHEGGIRYNDPRISIDWPSEVTELSARDSQHPLITSDFRGIRL
jgi:dTDP-4-dehydrorhamnose 3,5-epimerase